MWRNAGSGFLVQRIGLRHVIKVALLGGRGCGCTTPVQSGHFVERISFVSTLSVSCASVADRLMFITSITTAWAMN